MEYAMHKEAYVQLCHDPKEAYLRQEEAHLLERAERVLFAYRLRSRKGTGHSLTDA